MGIRSSQASGELHQPEQEFGAQHQELPTTDSVVAPCQSGDTGDVKLATQETKRSEFSAAKSRKRKGRSDHAASCSKDSKESQRPPAKSPKVNEIQTAHSIKTRRRNSL